MSGLGAVIMLGAGGNTPQEQLVRDAQRANTRDLLDLLRAQKVERIVLAAPQTDWLSDDRDLIRADDLPNAPFHFGQRLAALIDAYRYDPALYFGGGSTPLLDSTLMETIVGIVQQAAAPGSSNLPDRLALTNNLYSSDWIGFTRTAHALPILADQRRDNSIAWALRENGGYERRPLSTLRPATGFDIDTPTDLALLAQHPHILPNLRAALNDVRLSSIPIEAVLNLLRQDGKTVALIGRVSPAAWSALNRVCRVWTRVFAEERGMVASEREARGEVRSMLLPLLETLGIEGFFARLAEMADAVLFDTRVLFAARGIAPSAADRYASDLLWHWAIEDEWLRAFTFAAATAPIPVVLGGHSLVSGGLHAIAEILQRG